MKDRSTVGLYFAPGPSNEIKGLVVGSGPVKTAGSPVSFSTAVDQDLQALAFRPDPSLSNVGLQVDTVTPGWCPNAVDSPRGSAQLVAPLLVRSAGHVAERDPDRSESGDRWRRYVAATGRHATPAAKTRRGAGAGDVRCRRQRVVTES